MVQKRERATVWRMRHSRSHLSAFHFSPNSAKTPHPRSCVRQGGPIRPTESGALRIDATYDYRRSSRQISAGFCLGQPSIFNYYNANTKADVQEKVLSSAFIVVMILPALAVVCRRVLDGAMQLSNGRRPAKSLYPQMRSPCARSSPADQLNLRCGAVMFGGQHTHLALRDRIWRTAASPPRS